MQPIAAWLEKLGMSEYVQRFAENDLDISVLPHLTDQDFKELGVSLGHRRKLLAAIAEFSGVAPSAPPSTALTEPKPQDSAERRQVTVMFSDLVGSTALSARLDPEDLREVVAAYQKCVAETVGRFGGFVAKYMGDGVLVYFGYPQAHEDDAERAARAGLQLIAAVGVIKSHTPLQARVGIATGLVVVGDLIGSGEAAERGIVGETPNLAARLQGIAEPNMVVIAESTRRLLGNLFELEDLGAKDLKGIAGPVRAYAVLRIGSVESRFDAMHASGVTALVGREEETELLLRRWAKAKNGEGQVLLLSGEAGIGKSRLTAAVLENLAAEPHTRLRYFCSPQHTDSAFYPIIGQMERAAGLTYTDTAQAKLDKLDATLARTTTSKQDAALFAELLSLPNDGRYPAVVLTPQQRRQKTMEALGSQMEALARQNPLLMVFEDAHWTDPTSLELFGRAVDRIASLNVLLIVTFRPEFVPPWIGRPHVTSLTLNRLTQRDIDAMIDRVVGNKQLLASIRQDIIERTDGIPLFVEEMTKAVLEAEGETEVQRTAAAVPTSKVAVPASLHASLMARLDRLGPAKELAQIGAALGREFSHAVLAAVVRKPDAELEMALDRLLAAGLLFRQGVPPHATYLFKHALVQDAAYGTLLREPRRALHARVAEALENQFAEIAENQPELLARHCTEAGLIEKAAGLWGKAGQRSLARSALVEAAEQVTRALGQIETLPSTPALRREQINLQVVLISALFHVKGPAAAETKAAVEYASALIEHAEKLGEQPQDPLLLFSVLYGGWVANYVAFNGDIMRALAAQFLALAQKQGGAVPLMIGHRIMGISSAFAGHLAEGRSHYDQALVLYDPVEHPPLAPRFGQDNKSSVLSYRAFALWLLGYPDAAQAEANHALSHARHVGHAGTIMNTLSLVPIVPFLCGDNATTEGQLDELIALAEEKNALFWKMFAMLGKGGLLATTGKAVEAIQIFVSGMKGFRSTGATMFEPWWLHHLGRAHARLGALDDASRCLDEALTMVETRKDRWSEPELHRIAGEIALKSPKRDVAKAQACFDRALIVARAQQAKSWELRAAMSLARLWARSRQAQGRAQSACAGL